MWLCLIPLSGILQAYSVNRCPCPQPEQNSPEVLQLLRKTGNAFRQVGDILLKKTGSSAAAAASPRRPGVYAGRSFPQQSYPPQGFPQQAYPQQSYPPQGSVVYYPVPFPSAGVPQVRQVASCGFISVVVFFGV